MHKIVMLFIVVLLLGCNKEKAVQKEKTNSEDSNRVYNEKVYGTFIKLNEEMFGVDFCTCNLNKVLSKLENTKATYFDYNHDGERIENTENMMGIISRTFIGEGLDEKEIIEVDYFLSSPANAGNTRISVQIKFKQSYYDNLLKMLSEIYPINSASKNVLGYGEISWYANPDLSIPTCVSEVSISKKLRYSNRNLYLLSKIRN